MTYFSLRLHRFTVVTFFLQTSSLTADIFFLHFHHWHILFCRFHCSRVACGLVFVYFYCGFHCLENVSLHIVLEMRIPGFIFTFYRRSQDSFIWFFSHLWLVQIGAVFTRATQERYFILMQCPRSVYLLCIKSYRLFHVLLFKLNFRAYFKKNCILLNWVIVYFKIRLKYSLIHFAHAFSRSRKRSPTSCWFSILTKTVLHLFKWLTPLSIFLIYNISVISCKIVLLPWLRM